LNSTSKWIVYLLMLCAVAFLSLERIHAAGLYDREVSISVTAGHR
jgi:hypothetical protein